VIATTNPTIDRITGKLSDQSLLFRYTIKLVLLVSFSELILYRLVSRLGMHLSKLAQEHEWIIPTFTALTQIGQWLLNVVAILLFLALSVAAINRVASRGFAGSNMIVIPCVALLLLLTVGFLLVPPAFLGSAIYNIVALVALICLMVEYISPISSGSVAGCIIRSCPPSIVLLEPWPLRPSCTRRTVEVKGY
jgi:hypothetical protein